MDNKRRESLRKAASIASSKSQNGQSCARQNNCSPNFKIKHISDIEKGERILNEKILGNV
ncbi:MAG: hypothetical protein ABFD25_11370 [Clostridiaceae bacterium]